MTGFAPFERNSSVMDVLFCIIDNKNNVKKMVKVLKQPQSSVSRKMKFLLKNRIVIKKKWSFEVNWKELNKVFLKEAKTQIKAWVGDDKKVNRFIGLFNENRIKSILEKYAEHFMNGDLKAKSISAIANDYLLGLVETDDNALKEIDVIFVDLKSIILIESKHKTLFAESEGIERVKR
jgi:hypothetical protein